MLSSLHWLCCSAFEFALTLFALHSSLHWLWEAICAAPPAATRPSPLPPSVANPRRFSGPCMVLDVNNILLVDISSRFEQCQWIICSTGPDLCDLYSMTWGGGFGGVGPKSANIWIQFHLAFNYDALLIESLWSQYFLLLESLCPFNNIFTPSHITSANGGGEGVWKMVTIGDEGKRGGHPKTDWQKNPKFGRHDVWPAPICVWVCEMRR